jgi:hypothetical protein
MTLEHDLKLAQADSRIEEAERNIRHVEALLPWLSAQGFATTEIEDQLGLMSSSGSPASLRPPGPPPSRSGLACASGPSGSP